LQVRHKVGREDARSLEALLGPSEPTNETLFPGIIYRIEGEKYSLGRTTPLGWGFFLTSMHVVSDYRQKGDVWESLKNMELLPDESLLFFDPVKCAYSGARILAADLSMDIALGRLDRVYESDTVHIEQRKFMEHEEVTVPLYLNNAKLKIAKDCENKKPPEFKELEPRIRKSHVMTSYIVEPSKLGPGIEYLLEMPGFKEGGSGNPVYNSAGRLAGICGYLNKFKPADIDFAGVVSNLHIRKFIESYLDRC